MESQVAMRARYIVGRLIALPLLHKLIAAAIPVAFILADFIWTPHLPPQEYMSTALLFFDKTAAAKLDPSRLHEHQTQPVELAKSILSDDVVEALCKHFGLYPDSSGGEVARFRSSLMLSPESTSSLRVTWRGAGRSQTMGVTNTITVLLTSWIPDDTTLQSSDPAPSVAAPPTTPITPTAPVEQTPHVGEAEAKLSLVKARLESVLNEQEELRSALGTADQRLAALGEEARRLEATVGQINAEREAAITARQPLTVQLAAERKNLDALRLRCTDAYPDVEAAPERIAETEEKLSAMPPVRPAPDADQSRMDSATKEMNLLWAERSRLSSQLLNNAKLEANIRRQEDSMQATQPEHASTEPPPAQSKPLLSDPVPPRVLATENSQTVDSTGGDQVRLFKILERAVYAQPTNNSRHLLIGMIAAAGPLCGITYLILAIWWFRAVRNVETLERIVPGNIAYLGAIPGMSAWRHNV
jgi:hypothetical protein